MLSAPLQNVQVSGRVEAGELSSYCANQSCGLDNHDGLGCKRCVVFLKVPYPFRGQTAKATDGCAIFGSLSSFLR